MDNTVVENIDVNIKHKHITAFYRKGGSLNNIILLILSTLKSNEFATTRWIRSILPTCQIRIENDRVMACITNLKQKLKFIDGKEYNEKANVVDYKEAKKAKVGKKRSGNIHPGNMIRLNDLGRERLKKIIKDNSECFKD